MHNKKMLILMTVISLVAILFTAPTALADNGTDSSALRAAVTTGGIISHLQKFQDIASTHPDYRVAGSIGYDETAQYIEDQLKAAGYAPTRQYFSFDSFQELTPAVMNQTAPGSVNYGYDVDFYTMSYSGSGNVTAAVQAVDLLLPPVGGSTSGCDGDFAEVGDGGFGNIVPDPTGPNDFAGFTPGNIALLQRGTCTFALKAINAQAAGASGVIIFNEGNTPDRSTLLYGTLGGPGVNIPVVGATFALGDTLNGLIGSGLTLYLMTDTLSETRTTYNIIAETQGRTDRAVVVGAHIDSTSEGPGINDNGSASATILEIARQMKALNIQPRNQVRFIWFSAEEEGLLGSTYYVSQLSTRQVKDISIMLDFDMLASNNYALLVYDGDGSATPNAGPNGSANVEKVFLDYFASQNLTTFPTAFDGRSDYGPFIAVGIPAGGVFAGADELKTAEQQALYGGTTGQYLDPYYHTANDTLANINVTALDRLSDAVVDAVFQFAMTTSAVNGTEKGNGGGSSKFEYLGSSLQR